MINLKRASAALLIALGTSTGVIATDAPPSTTAPAAVSTDVFPAAPQRDLVVRTCAACHAPEIVVAKRHTVDEWDEIIAKMVDRGALATDSEQEQILQYLATFFGPAPADAASAHRP